MGEVVELKPGIRKDSKEAADQDMEKVDLYNGIERAMTKINTYIMKTLGEHDVDISPAGGKVPYAGHVLIGEAIRAQAYLACDEYHPLQTFAKEFLETITNGGETNDNS